MRPFGCPITIFNTIDYLGKFDGKADEGFFVGYSLNSSGSDWLFDIDALTKTINYEPIVAGKQSNGFASIKASDNAGQARKETELVKNYILLPLWTVNPPYSQDLKSSHDDGSKPSSDDGKKVDEDPRKDSECNDQEKEDNVNSINTINVTGTNKVNVVGGKTSIELPFDPNMPALEDVSIFDFSRDDDDVGAEVDINNLDTTIQVSLIPTTRIHKDHPLEQVIGDLQSATQTRKMSKILKEHGFVSIIQQRTNHKDLQNCLFACFLSQEEPKRVIHALKDPRWIEAMQEELLQFKLQEVWTLVDLPNGKRAIGTKWVFRNKKDERGIVIRNKARLVAHGYIQEEGIDYDEVFAPVARIKAIRLFLAYALFKDFVVYQMDVKSVFLYGKIEEEVYVCQPPGFEDSNFPDRVYKVEKALYGLHQAPRAWYETLSTYLLDNGFQRGKIDKTLFIKRHKGDILLAQVYVDDIIFSSTKKELLQRKKYGIFISQDKYVEEILKKFGFTEVKIASTPMETQKPLLKDEDGEEVDVHMYRSMIGSLMYLTSSRPDIMFVVCACARYQVNPKVSHLHVVKRIFRYLKGQPKLGLWYLKDSLFDLVAYTDSDYAGASLDRKSTTGGCQFLRCRLISWQCKKQTVVANSTTEAEYVAASSCCRQVLWIQNQLLDYGPKTTTWNEFSSTMASAIICLATNQKFNFSKFILEGMIRNLDNVSGKFLMYPKFVQVFLNQQLDRLPTHKRIYNAPSHTKKIFGNMRRVGKGFSGRVTPLFPTMVPQPSDPSDNVADDAVHKELGDSGGPRCQETKGDTIAQTRFENVSKLSNDSLLAIGNTLRSDEDRLKLNELMELYTTLQKKVLDLEKKNTTQANEIDSLKRRVKKLEKKDRSRTHKLKRLYKVGLTARVESSGYEEDLGEDASKQERMINSIDADEDITLVNVQDDDDNEMFDVDALNGEEVFVAGQNENVVEKVVNAAQVSTAATTVIITTEEITLAQALEALKTLKPKVKGIVFQEPCKSTTTTTTISSQQSQDRCRREEEQTTNPSSTKKNHVYLPEEYGRKEAQDLKNKSFNSIKKMFHRAFKKVNTFVDFITDLVKDTTKLQSLMEVIPDEEDVAIDVVPLATKSPKIVDWKIHKEGKKSYY
ncbi:putative ribonuclease H-like domain-containing protein [Tanacetum coccineum]